eukprot:3825874-Rhodomonas_salina.1
MPVPHGTEIAYRSSTQVLLLNAISVPHTQPHLLTLVPRAPSQYCPLHRLIRCLSTAHYIG